MQLRDAAAAFLTHRRQQGRCGGTITAYQQHLAAWQSWRAAEGYAPDVAAVSLAEVRVFVAELAGRLKARSVHNYVRSMRAVWNWLDQESDAAGAPLLAEGQRRIFAAGRIPLPAIVERERPALTRAQLGALLGAVGAGVTEEAARDRAILLLLWESGMRVHEVAELTTDRVDLSQRTAIIIGKGSKEAPVFWGENGARALLRYLRLRRGPLAGPLFRGCSSRNDGGAVTANLIRLMVKRRAEAAGVVLPKGAVVHCFRHGAAREWRRRGATREEVGELLRHSDMETTLLYLGLDIEPRRQVHRRLFEKPAEDGPAARRDEG